MVSWYPPASGHGVIGGSQSHVVYLLGGLARRPELEMHVIARRSGGPVAGVQTANGLTVHLTPRARFQRLMLYRIDVARLVKEIRNLQPDVVHGHSTSLYADAAISSGIPHVITIHGIIYREARLERGVRDRLSFALDALYERYNMERTQHIIAYSPYAAEECAQLAPHARIHRIDNPVDERYFKLEGEPEPGVILCPARLRPLKGILTLLQAFAMVHRDFPQARLRIAGETHVYPDYAAQCREYVQREGLTDAVEFLGWQNEQTMRSEYSRAAIMVLASQQENAPLSIVEAMASRRPVVATRVGGIPSLVSEGRTGLLVPPNAPEPLAQALICLLRDPALAREMGQEGRAEALRRFHPDAVAEQTAALYHRIAGRAG
jgi:glycosyltransferase involved in cell wall biosynthesis